MARLAAVVLALAVVGSVSADGQAPVPSPIEATWRIVELPGHAPAALAAMPQPANLRFEAGRVSGFTGCNNVSGSYTLNAGRITFGPLAGTMRACMGPISEIERTFMTALTGTMGYTVAGDRLTLTPASGAPLVFEREQQRTPESNAWNVTGFNNGRDAVVSVAAGTTLTLTFEGNTVSGNAGCNTFRAPYAIQGQRITIGPVVTTRMACDPAVMTQEREFLEALQSVVRWAVDNRMLDMHRSDDQRALTAAPATR